MRIFCKLTKLNVLNRKFITQGQKVLTYGEIKFDLVLCSIQFSFLSKLHQKTTIDSKVVKTDTKLIISLRDISCMCLCTNCCLKCLSYFTYLRTIDFFLLVNLNLRPLYKRWSQDPSFIFLSLSLSQIFLFFFDPFIGACKDSLVYSSY